MPETNNMAHERLGPLLPNSLSLDSQIQIRAKGEPGSTWRTVRLQERSLGKQDGRMGPSRFDDGLGDDFQPSAPQLLEAARGVVSVVRERIQERQGRMIDDGQIAARLQMGEENNHSINQPARQESTLKRLQLKKGVPMPNLRDDIELQEHPEDENNNETNGEAGQKIGLLAGILAATTWVGDHVDELAREVADTIRYGRRRAINMKFWRRIAIEDATRAEHQSSSSEESLQDEQGMTSTMREEGQSPNEGTPSHVAAAPNGTPVLRVLRPLQQPTELSGVRRILRPSVAPPSSPGVDDFWGPPRDVDEVPDWVREAPRAEAESVSPVTPTGPSETEEPLELEESPTIALDKVLSGKKTEWKGLSPETICLLAELNENPFSIFILLTSAKPDELAQIKEAAEGSRLYRFILDTNNWMAYELLDTAIEAKILPEVW